MNNFGNMRQNNQDFALLMNNMNNQGNSMGMLNMNMNGMNQMGQGQMSNQNMNMMPPYFGNDFMNQQQQMNIGKLTKKTISLRNLEKEDGNASGVTISTLKVISYYIT